MAAMRRIAGVVLLVLTACTGETVTSTSSTLESSTVTTRLVTTTSQPVASSSVITTSTTTTTTLPPLQGLRYEHVTDLRFPVQMSARPGEDIAYVITKGGVVWSFHDGVLGTGPVLDISDQVRDRGEQGLLSIALHPTDQSRLFLHYSSLEGDTVVSEFRLTDPHHVAADSESILLQVDQPAGNHNGGMLQFYQGKLYLGLGDGGGAGDQFDNGQNQGTLLGGLVAIDVDGAVEPTLYMYGLRNPWRFWIDGDTIYIADVGQGSFEEVNITDMRPGQNLGWPIMEGLHCYRPASGCNPEGLVLPVVEIAHGDAGTCSVIGGVVYRGNAIPELVGEFFYSDYCGGYLRSVSMANGVPAETDWTDQVGVAGRVAGFGVDGAGEVFVMTTESMLALVAER